MKHSAAEPRDGAAPALARRAAGRRIVLACACDDGFAPLLGVMLCSVLENLNPRTALQVYVLDGGIRLAHQRKLDALAARYPAAALCWLRPDPGLLVGLKEDGHITGAAYLRLLVSHLLPRSVEKVIYLDADLVVEADLTELWEEPLEGAALAAVQDYRVQQVSYPTGVRRYRELGLAADHPYFNSGVLVLDLAYWRRERVASRVVRYLRDYAADVVLWDQDGLNAILGHHWRRLDPAWNRMSWFHELETQEPTPYVRDLLGRADGLREHPRIVHFAGRYKPWVLGPRHPDFGIFYRYLLASGWFSPVARRWWFFRQRVRGDEDHPLYEPLRRLRQATGRWRAYRARRRVGRAP